MLTAMHVHNVPDHLQASNVSVAAAPADATPGAMPQRAPFTQQRSQSASAHHAEHPPSSSQEPSAEMQQLREDWQSRVVHQLMHIKDVYGVPLARRQRDESALADLRSTGALLASERVGIKQQAAGSTSAPSLPEPHAHRLHVVSQGMLLQGVYAALTGKCLADCEAETGVPEQV